MPQLLRLLSIEELAKAQRYRFEADHDRHVVLWAGLRLILGSLVNTSPAALEFVRTQAGKPELSEPPVSLVFNATHAGAFVVFAVSRGGPVGVDIEEVRADLETAAIVNEFFHRDERLEFEALSEDLKLRSFFRSWTLKESYLKARGVGLPFGLDRVRVTIDPTKAPRLITVEGMKGEPDRWDLADLPMPDGYFGSVTSQGRGRETRFLELELESLLSVAKNAEDC
jgi:4'-phosphopantetheinyl transferase